MQNHPLFPVRPPSPEQLLASLQMIFPSFDSVALRDDLKDDLWRGSGLHCIMRHFIEFFGSTRADASDLQLKALGRLIDEAVTFDDVFENAVSTCMLEHLHQIDGYMVLAPYLSSKAKERTGS